MSAPAADGKGAPERLDHLLWACPDLAAGMRRFEALSGVAPKFGGVHSGGVTHNALVALGPRCYLEILAPTGPASPADDSFSRLARSMAEPGIITYCMRSAVSLEELAARARRAGAQEATVASNGRTTPEGVKLSWRWLAPKLERFGLAFPFFIDWLDSPHPATTLGPQAAGSGVRLRRFIVGHPDAAELGRVLLELGAPIETEPAPSLRFSAELDTPRGRIHL
jgi:hypothetical protein